MARDVEGSYRARKDAVPLEERLAALSCALEALEEAGVAWLEAKVQGDTTRADEALSEALREARAAQRRLDRTRARESAQKTRDERIGNEGASNPVD